MLNNYICALDISSSKIAACVAEIRKRRILNIFFESLPSKGIKKGSIIDSVDLAGSVGKVLKGLKEKSGINIKFVYVNIPSHDIVAKHSRAVIPLTERGNKIITLSDIQKVNEQAVMLGPEIDEEIIHHMPFGYTLDSRVEIANPLGLYSRRLGVDLYLICGKLAAVRNLEHIISQAGYEIKEALFSGLATSSVVFDFAKESKNGVNILCDMGSDVTELIVFSDGLLKDIQILPFGGDDFTKDLADALKIPFLLAEDIKKSYGIIGEAGKIPEEKEILVKKENFYNPIKERAVCEILTLRAEVLSSALRKSIEKIVSPAEINNFVACGRGLLLEGFLEMLEKDLRVRMKFGRILDSDMVALAAKNGLLAGQKYLTYITAMGIIRRALSSSDRQPKGQPVIPFSRQNPAMRVINKIKEIYQEYF